jgi:HemY protein
MKRLISLIFLIGLAVIAATAIDLPLGDISILAPPYRIDMSLQVAIVGAIMLFVLFYIALRFLAVIAGIPNRIRLFQRKRQQDHLLKTLATLTTDYLEGRFARVLKTAKEVKSQQDLVKSSPRAVSAAIALGARAAHEMRDPYLRDSLLTQLKAMEESGHKTDPMIAPLLEAQFAVEEHKGAAALTALAPLTRGDRRHVHTMRIALRANQQEEKWDEVLRITKLLENRKAINLVSAARYKGQVAKAWIAAGRHHEARKLLETAINQEWDSGLCMLYASCEDSPKDQLAKLELWLQRRPQNAELNWSLGRLCQRQQLWGKARMHLEASLRQKPMAQTHLALAEIAESLGEKETAAIHWKAAAQLR